MNYETYPTYAVPAYGISTYSPWKDPLKCPLILYTILVVLGFLWMLASFSRVPAVDRNGNAINSNSKWFAFIIGLIIYIIIAYLFGLWIYNLCKGGHVLSSWLVFLLAIFFPLILTLVIGAIVGAILGIGYFFGGF